MAQLLFRLTALIATGFVITILAMVAMLLGDPFAPVNVWFNRNGAIVLLIEVAAIVICGIGAMMADRRETLRSRSTPTESGAKPAQPQSGTSKD